MTTVKLPLEMVEKFHQAADHFQIRNLAAYFRTCAAVLIKHHEAGDGLIVPFAFQRSSRANPKESSNPPAPGVSVKLTYAILKATCDALQRDLCANGLVLIGSKDHYPSNKQLLELIYAPLLQEAKLKSDLQPQHSPGRNQENPKLCP